MTSEEMEYMIKRQSGNSQLPIMNLEFLSISSGRDGDNYVWSKSSEPEGDQEGTGTDTSNTQHVQYYKDKLIGDMMRQYVYDNLSDEKKSCEDLIQDLGNKRTSIQTNVNTILKK